MKKLSLIGVGLLALTLSSCGMGMSQYENVPAGYVGRVLTPTGWQDNTLESGQVNLGGSDADGRSNSLVLLEASAVQVKEQFGASQGDPPQDHRVVTAGCPGSSPMPVAIDVYLRLRVPEDAQLRNRVFAEITPAPSENNNRVSWITVQAVYNRYVLQEARSTIRQVMGAFCDDRAMNADRPEAERRLFEAINARLAQLHAPLQIQSVSLSNIAADPQVQQARNSQASNVSTVAAINEQGRAIAANPGYARYLEAQASYMSAQAQLEAVRRNNVPVIISSGTGAMVNVQPRAQPQ